MSISASLYSEGSQAEFTCTGDKPLSAEPGTDAEKASRVRVRAATSIHH